jgi:hypothetical protein
MPTVHPTYDPNDRLWFTDDGVTAKSLSSLQRKLPGVVIEDYYPNGYGNIIKPRPPEVVKATLKQVLGGSNPVRRRWPLSASVSDTGTETTVTTQQPAEVPPIEVPVVPEASPEVTVTQPKLVEPPPRPYRERVVRTRKPSGLPNVDWKIRSNRELLKGLVEAGLTSQQIGNKMGCTRNAIIGACARLGYGLKYNKGGVAKARADR